MRSQPYNDRQYRVVKPGAVSSPSSPGSIWINNSIFSSPKIQNLGSEEFTWGANHGTRVAGE